jgi:hypothetical protein
MRWDSCRNISWYCLIRSASWTSYITPIEAACIFETRYGVFMTGPSATADVEGVLIHGAQASAA